MKTAKLLFLVFLGIFVVGCASCIPGICGCAFSIWPSSWEESITTPAILMDVIGFAGMVICGIILLIFWTRRKTIADTARILAEQDTNKEQG